MSGVITDVIDCPQCGFPAQLDEYYIEGEERVTCDWCGYSHTKNHKGTESSKGFGSIHYVAIEDESLQSNVKLKLPLSIQERHTIIMHLESGSYNKQKSSFFVWDDEANELECLLGEKPQTINEYYDAKASEALMQMRSENPFLLSDFLNDFED